MSGLQNLTKTENTNQEATDSVISPADELLKLKQQQWIDFCAIGGLMTEDDGTLKPTTATAFAEMIGVSRQTLYDWKKNIPDFQERVNQRRKILGAGTRLQKVYNGLYLKAAAGNPDAVKLWLQIFDGWKPPKQEMEIEHNLGLADLVAKKKLEMERERKVIDATPADTGSSEQTAHS
jgi:hypothetical protein